MDSPPIERFHVCTRCAHAEARRRAWSRCPECGWTGSWEISGPDALRGLFATIDKIRAGA
jgi:hypothetical protein